MASARASAAAPPDLDVDRDDGPTNPRLNSYRWEKKASNKWSDLHKRLSTDPSAAAAAHHSARKRRLQHALSGVRRAVIRFTVLVLDLSAAARATDYKPTRAELTSDAAVAFIRAFFLANPLSQLSIVVTRDAHALRISPFSASHRAHVDAVERALRAPPHGPASLQNALLLARRSLAAAPPYALREVVVCFASLSTCDPADIHATIADLAADRARCSAVAMAAELHVLRALTRATDGSYVVALNEAHFREALHAHVVPPPTTTRQVAASLIRMGFPPLRRDDEPRPFCNNPSLKGRLGYRCPRCSAWLSDVPAECTLCGLTLVSSPHLARSYHHLFPVPEFVDLDAFTAASALPPLDKHPAAVERRIAKLQAQDALRCTGCSALFPKAAVQLVCPACLHVYCIECDNFIHDSLHNCVGCGLKQDPEHIIDFDDAGHAGAN